MAVISVSDAREHRIPNNMLLLLLVLMGVDILTQIPKDMLFTVFLDRGSAFLVTLLVGFVLYVLRVVAPGDVKLIAVLGFYLGTNELIVFMYYVCLMTVMVGSMYWFLNHLYMSSNVGANEFARGRASFMSLTGLAVNMDLSQHELKKKIFVDKKLTYMPFAPVLVMGLAMQQYYA